jgi:nicotinamidase-related amidase
MKLDANKTALLTLDFQHGIFGIAAGAESIVPTAAKVVELAREKQLFLAHVGLGFNAGYPELDDRSPMAARVKQAQMFLHGSPSAQFHASIARPGELVVYKQRVGAFSENQLHLILRARGIENLVLFGISTSGIVLSTLRRAFDLDYRCVVIKDACFDRDAEVHRVLTEKVFVGQAMVMTADEFIAAQA